MALVLPPFRPKWDIHGAGPSLEEVMPKAGQLIEGDPNVIAALPSDCTFVEATSYGASLWTRTAKITTKNANGVRRLFFMKLSTGEAGKTMLHGEYEGMLAIYHVMPSFAPEPIAWGKYQDTPETYFFICDFVEMEEALPDAGEFCSKLAELHRKSVSPTGKFGFHVTTCNGTTPQLNTWEESWEVFFTNGLRHMLALDERVNGKQPELEAAAAELFEHVIPRLLRPLQEGPSPIKPALVHGDMWWGNTAINLKNDSTVIFDASAFYAHNEYEMGNWRPIRSRFDKHYFRTYVKHYPVARPEKDYDDRVLLYSMRFDFQLCILFPGSTIVKNTLIENMRYLADKYSDPEVIAVDQLEPNEEG